MEDETNANLVEIGVGEASIDPLHGVGAPQVLDTVTSSDDNNQAVMDPETDNGSMVSNVTTSQILEYMNSSAASPELSKAEDRDSGTQSLKSLEDQAMESPGSKLELKSDNEEDNEILKEIHADEEFQETLLNVALELENDDLETLDEKDEESEVEQAVESPQVGSRLEQQHEDSTESDTEKVTIKSKSESEDNANVEESEGNEGDTDGERESGTQSKLEESESGKEEQESETEKPEESETEQEEVASRPQSGSQHNEVPFFTESRPHSGSSTHEQN